MPHLIMEMEEVPYRCPKCGEGDGISSSLKFPSLRALRDHLENDHSYLTPKKAETRLSGSTPLSESFNREARELEKQLKHAKDTELKHRQQWNKLMEPSNSALENIDREIRKSRQQKQELDDALNDAMEKIDHMRRSADAVAADQKEAVHRLQDRLSQKEADLDLLKSELDSLADDKSCLEREIRDMSHKQDHKDDLIGHLKQEIQEKEHQINQKEKEVSEMSNFLQETSQKEAVAREKLEDFIENLFERTEAAEGQVQQMRRSLAMSQEGLGLLGDAAGSLPILADPDIRHSLPGGVRRPLPHFDMSRSANDILATGEPNLGHMHSSGMGPLDRSQSADPLLSSQCQTPSSLPSHPVNGLVHPAQSSSTLASIPPMNGLNQTSPSKGYHGDRTSDYGSMSSYAVTSPKSQPLEAAHLNHVSEDTVMEETIVPLKKQSTERGFVPSMTQAQDPIHISTQKLDHSAGPSLSGHHGNHYPVHSNPLTGSHGNGLDVDEHGIMWDTDVQVLPPHVNPHGFNVMAAPSRNNHAKMYPSPMLDTPVSLNTELGGYQGNNNLDLMQQVARQLERRPLHRMDSTTSSQQEIVEEINRNTEKILSQQREMLSKQLAFLAKQQEFLNKGFAELRLHKHKGRIDSTSLDEADNEEEAEETYTETEEDEGSVTNVTDHAASESEGDLAADDREEEEEDNASEISHHTVLRDNVPQVHEEPTLEYHPQSYLSPPTQLSPPSSQFSPGSNYGSRGPALETPGVYHGKDNDRRHRKLSPKKYRGRFIAPGHKNADIKQMVTTTVWAVPTASPYPRSPLNALPRPNFPPYHSIPASPTHHPYHRLLHEPHRGATTKEGRELEALFCVLMYLDVYTLSQVAQVCKAWRQLSQHPALWRTLAFRRVHVCSKYLIHIAKFCTELHKFTLEGLQSRPRKSHEDVPEFRKKTRGSLEEGLEAVMRVSGSSLKTIKVIDCGNLLTDRCLWLASCYSRNLQDVTYISDLDPVGSEVIWSLGAGCRQITRLVIPPMFPNQNPHKFNNHCVFNIARCWPDLHTLSIGGVDVTARGLAAIAHFCSKLQSLELDHMCEITEETAIAVCKAGLKGLRDLHLTFTPITPKALLHFTSACPHLSNITVRVGISDYYQDTELPQHREEFAAIISKLRKLQQRPGFHEKLHLNVDYGPQKLAIPAPNKHHD